MKLGSEAAGEFVLGVCALLFVKLIVLFIYRLIVMGLWNVYCTDWRLVTVTLTL